MKKNKMGYLILTHFILLGSGCYTSMSDKSQAWQEVDGEESRIEELDTEDIYSIEVENEMEDPLTTTCNSNEDCDDGLFCNGKEICTTDDDQSICLPAEEEPCPHAIGCIMVECNEESDTCTPKILDDSLCNDGLACNGIEICAPASPEADGMGCIKGTPPTCTPPFDSECTHALCIEPDGTCAFIADNDSCRPNEICAGPRGECGCKLPCNNNPYCLTGFCVDPETGQGHCAECDPALGSGPCSLGGGNCLAPCGDCSE